MLEFQAGARRRLPSGRMCCLWKEGAALEGLKMYPERQPVLLNPDMAGWMRKRRLRREGVKLALMAPVAAL